MAELHKASHDSYNKTWQGALSYVTRPKRLVRMTALTKFLKCDKPLAEFSMLCRT